MLYKMLTLRLLNSGHRNEKLIKIVSLKYSTHHFKFIESQEKWRRNDNVSKRWELIYKAPMHNALNWATTYLTVTTGIFTCAGIYYLLVGSKSRDPSQPVLLGDSDVIIADNFQECLIYLGAYVLLHIGVKILLSKYVIRMYKDGDKYLAIYRGHFFNSISKHEFQLKEFKKLNPTFVVSWGDARYSLGGKHGILLDNYFKTPAVFNRLLYKDNKISEE